MTIDPQTKMTASEALKYLQGCYQKGVEFNQENGAARIALRIVVANRVKALRMENGYSQEQFSDIVRTPFLTYKGYENRRSDIPLHTLVRIANELNTSLDYLTGRTENRGQLSLDERLTKLEEVYRQRSSE